MLICIRYSAFLCSDLFPPVGSLSMVFISTGSAGPAPKTVNQVIAANQI